ncbi:conserved hypothetical protein [Uncinocarpus reesii 1704]|uniref:Cystinosin n=1 Tax=Uncinocarpus reesii (strain UAMH 1704) TaxID=336963 RepID=C4JVX7_UNCRE|nr:uncharacterized protein UREG_06719 [Uncinocarpus reesii 1704]EEP81854.1 conserved hypothetical protein [Uncinocarpus reesii 1704]
MASQGEVFARAISRLIGWIYMFCWSASFYPQPILNWRRRSTHGLAIDFPTTNVLGFICYAIYTTAFLYSPTIREQYAARHPISPEPSVRINDFAFAVHAVILSATVYSQFFPWIWRFKVSKSQRIYTISYVKLVVTVIKYIPQAWVNYKRKSTIGWSIGQILFDFSGGVLSILQLVIDSALEDDWSGITGNPIKLALGNVSIFFDLIFMAQHYIIYPDKRVALKDDDDDGLSRPLLVDNEREIVP